jgi:pilus assembly protein CpaB
MVVVALLFGGAAAIGVRYWLENQRREAAAEVEAPVATSTLVVASQPLKFGAPLTEKTVKEVAWPDNLRPTGSYSKISAMLKDGPRYVISPMVENEPVIAGKVTGPGQRPTLSTLVAANRKAVTIRVNDVNGVAGFVLPEDRVDILLTRTDPVTQKPFVDVLLQEIKVLAADQIAEPKRDQPVVAKAITVEVTMEQAQILTLAARTGQLSLALRHVAGREQAPTRRITIADLGGAPPSAEPPPAPAKIEQPAEAPKPSPLPPALSKPDRTQVNVVSNTGQQTYDVIIAR